MFTKKWASSFNKVLQIYQFLYGLLMHTLYSSNTVFKNNNALSTLKAAITDIGWSDLFSCYKISLRQIHNVKKNKSKCFLKGHMWWVIAAAEAAMVCLMVMVEQLMHWNVFIISCCQCIRYGLKTNILKEGGHIVYDMYLCDGM